MTVQAQENAAGEQIYRKMRDWALHATRESLDPVPEVKPGEPFGVIMEIGFEEGSATLVAFASGETSLYFSSGRIHIGGGKVERIHKAALEVVAVAAKSQEQFAATKEFPLPKNDEVVFYLLSDKGVSTASAPKEELAKKRHPLFDAGYAVITQYRLLDQKR